MKKIFTLLIGIFGSANLEAQVLGTNLDINNVMARINNNNNHFWDPIVQTNYYEVPQGSNKQTIYAGDLWIGGYDNANQLHVSADFVIANVQGQLEGKKYLLRVRLPHRSYKYAGLCQKQFYKSHRHL